MWNPFEFMEFERLFQQGVLTVAAAGNSGGGSFSYPASYEGVLSIAAVDNTTAVADFSQKNSRVDLAAPGVNVTSTFPMDGNCQICKELGVSAYGTISGTSMATPHVSGVAALLWSFEPLAGISDIRDAMLESAEDLGQPNRDNSYGFGLVKALDALELLNGGPIIGTPNSPTDPPASPPTDPPFELPIGISCEDGQMLVDVALQTDGHAEESFWEITRDSDSFTVWAGSLLKNNTLYEGSECLPVDCYTFTIYDAASDG